MLRSYKFSFSSCALLLVGFTLVSSLFLSSSSSFALQGEDPIRIIDRVQVTVPVSCTLSGVGMQSHKATINNGTYTSDIGTTTIKAYCNDKDGFAIYAIGYTDDTDGNNVLTNSELGSTANIATGTGTSGNSQWAMKLATDSNATYPLTLQNNYNAYHTVPDDYELVAKRTASTDVGSAAVGSTLTSTYQVFISSTQAAGTYNGKVKYVMVHPNSVYKPLKDEIEVIYNGDGLTFPGGVSTNRVIYSNSACDEPIDVGAPTIVKSSNLADDGSRIDNGFIEEEFNRTISFDGADEILVMVDYGLTYYSGISVVEGEWGGWGDGDPSGEYYGIGWDDEVYGHDNIFINGDTVTIDVRIWGEDYGAYIKLYPINEESELNTEAVSFCELSTTPISGVYSTTTTWNDKWYMVIDDEFVWSDAYSGEPAWFTSEEEIIDFLESRKKVENLLGSTVYIYAYNPYRVVYDGNNATSGTMSGFSMNFDTAFSEGRLAPPNYYKNGYGFAGWSEDHNASVGSSGTIYGPNQDVSALELDLDSNKHETTLYAVWVPSAGNLQNWSGCNGLVKGQVTALTDTRDNNTYAVAKLADGNCWMIENLRLDAANSSDNTKAQGFGGVFSGLADSEAPSSFNSTTSNAKYSTSNISGNNQMYRFPRYNNDNTDSPVANMTTTNANIYGYGNYYTWAAAMANTADLTTISGSESANTSICPAGWSLPYGNNTGNGNASGGFFYLSNRINHDPSITGSGAMRSFPNNFITSGYVSGSSITMRNSWAYYWSSSANSASNSYVMTINNSSVDPTSTLRKTTGSSIRCLIKN